MYVRTGLSGLGDAPPSNISTTTACSTLDPVWANFIATLNSVGSAAGGKVSASDPRVAAALAAVSVNCGPQANLIIRNMMTAGTWIPGTPLVGGSPTALSTPSAFAQSVASFVGGNPLLVFGGIGLILLLLVFGGKR